MLTPIRIFGKIRDATGKLYSGAVIEVTLNQQMVDQSALYGSENLTVYSGDYGNFEINLVPSVGGYYTFKFIKDIVTTYNKIVPKPAAGETITELNFDSLQDYTPTHMLPDIIGGCDTGGGTVVTPPPGNTSGLFLWYQPTVDGTSNTFTIPGEITLVHLNGQVQTENVDFIRRAYNVIEFLTTPLSGDILNVLYKV